MMADGDRRVSCLSNHHDAEAADSIEPGLAERVGIEPTVPLPGQQFSRLPDSATLAPLRLVELSSRPGRVGAIVSPWHSAVSELTLGNVIFQSVFFIGYVIWSSTCLDTKPL